MRRRPWVRPLVAAVVTATAAVVFVHPLRAQQDTGLTDVIMSVRLLRGPERVLLGHARDTVALLPVRAVLDLAEVRLTDFISGSHLGAVLEPGALGLVVSTADTSVWRGTRRIPFPADEAVWLNGELFASPAVIAAFLGAEPSVDWNELTVVLSDVDHLPAMVRLVRDARRRYAAGGLLGVVPDSVVPARNSALDGGVFEWSVLADFDAPVDNNVVQVGGGLAVLGGSLELTTLQQQSAGASSSTTRGAWVRAWPGSTRIRQVQLGDATIEVPTPVAVRGGLITNIPYLRPAEFGVTNLYGSLPPGWEVELMRSGRVVAFGAPDSTGRYRLDAPVAYGTNPTEVRFYGPKGEIQIRQRSLEVLPERLPVGRLEYLVGGGVCAVNGCDVGSADVRYGLSHAVTTRGGVLALRPEQGDVGWHPYAQVALAAGTSIQLVADAMVDGVARGRVLVSPTEDLRVDVRHTVFADSAVRSLLGGGGEDRRTDGTVFWRPRGGRLQLQGAFSASSEASRSLSQVRGGALVRLSNASVAFTLSRERLVAASVSVPRSAMEADGRLLVSRRGPLHQTLLGLTVSTACGGDWFACAPQLGRWRATAGRTLSDVLRLDIGVGRIRGRPGVELDVALTAMMPYARALTRTGRTPEGHWAGSQLVESSFLIDRPRRRVRLSDGRSIGRSGISGLVFFDRNGDGFRDPGEDGVPDILLRVGSRAAATDSLGRFDAVDLLPFERALVEVDTLSMPDPTWLAPAPVLAISPEPNAFNALRIGLIQGRELSGTVTLDGAEPGPVHLELLPADGGRVRPIATFGDGSFYLPAVRPGTYDLQVRAEDLERLGARSTPVRVTIAPDVEGAVLAQVLMMRR